MSKVLHFGGILQSKSALAGDNFDVGIRYSIDSNDSTLNPGVAFNITQQQIDDDVAMSVADKKAAHEEWFGDSFRVNGKYTLADFINFAIAKSLRLAIADSNGSNHVTLVANQSSSSL